MWQDPDYGRRRGHIQLGNVIRGLVPIKSLQRRRKQESGCCSRLWVSTFASVADSTCGDIVCRQNAHPVRHSVSHRAMFRWPFECAHAVWKRHWTWRRWSHTAFRLKSWGTTLAMYTVYLGTLALSRISRNELTASSSQCWRLRWIMLASVIIVPLSLLAFGWIF